MKNILVFFALLFSGISWAQPAENGMNFEHELTWNAIKAKAKKENKFIFMDAFTTWCGPCKMMAKNIFPQKQVGDFYNANYVNVKVQLDTTKNDNAEVKRWYQDAHDIMVGYNVNVFPTYLFFSPDGELVHRAVGASEAAAFIEKGKNALDPTKQYYALKKRYSNGDRDPAFLKNLSLAAVEAYDQKNIKAYSDAYFVTQTNLLTPDNIKFMQKFTFTSKDKGFEMMLKHPKEFDAVLGKGSSNSTTRMIIMQEDIFPVIWSNSRTPFKWEDLETKLETKYPKRGAELVSYSKVFYFQQQGDWDNFSPAVVKYMKEYGADVPAADLNNFAWAIFENCADMTCVEQAAEWAKRATKEKDANYFDTYANLLYKSGKRDIAIKAQEQTIAVAKQTNNTNLSEFEATLEKMKKGEKTW